jgi:eukaryotic-like serine/threonine-protein kinase
MLIADAVKTSQGCVVMPHELFGYEVVDFIGEGAGSLIYLVAHRRTQQVHALKHVVHRHEKDERFFEQLRNEFEVSRQFKNPVLRKSLELLDNHTLLRKATEAALVMELFDGSPLNPVKSGYLTAVVEYFIQVARGLGSLHSLGFAHCDLKPGNILINSVGEVKIIDFGQACPLGTIKERIQGTPDFIAPEQVKRQPVTIRTDIFNLGATFYWALTGRNVPTLYTIKKGENSFLLDEAFASPREINPEVPQPLSNLVMECVRTNPLKRPADMHELRRRLELAHHVVSRQMAVA